MTIVHGFVQMPLTLEASPTSGAPEYLMAKHSHFTFHCPPFNKSHGLWVFLGYLAGYYYITFRKCEELTAAGEDHETQLKAMWKMKLLMKTMSCSEKLMVHTFGQSLLKVIHDIVFCWTHKFKSYRHANNHWVKLDPIRFISHQCKTGVVLSRRSVSCNTLHKSLSSYQGINEY